MTKTLLQAVRVALEEVHRRMAQHDDIMEELKDVPGDNALERVRRLKTWYLRLQKDASRA